MANRYWVGGTGTWNTTNTTNWSATSGGAGGASVPTSADAVFINASSGTGTITVSGSVTALSVSCSGYTGSLTVGAGSLITCSGSFTLVSGMTVTYNGQLTLDGIGTLTSAGKTISIVSINTTGTITLSGALTCSNLALSSGTFVVNANSITTTTQFSISGTAAKTLTLTTSTITLSSASGNAFSYSGSNLTFNQGTSTINLTGTGSALDGGGLTFNNVAFTSTTVAGARGILGANTFAQLTFAAPSTADIAQYYFDSDQTITTFVCAGASAIRRIFLSSDAIGTRRTLTITTWSTISDVDFLDIGMSSSISGTRLGDCGNNNNITFPSPKTVYWNLSGTQDWSATGWATTSGGTPAIDNFPLAQDTAVFNNTGATGTVNITDDWNIGTLDMSARTNAMTLSGASSPIVYGNWTCGIGVTQSFTGSTRFFGFGTQTITSAGQSFYAVLAYNPSTIISLADAFSTTATSGTTVSLLNGASFNANTYSVTTSIFSGDTGTVGLGTGTWTITGTGTCWSCSNTTVTGTGEIVLSNNTTTARTFSGKASSTYGKLTIGGNTSTSTTTIVGTTMKFYEIASTKTVAHTIVFPNTTTTVGAFTVQGLSGNVVTLSRTGASGTFTLTKSGGGVVSSDYLSISNSTVNPLNTWYAGANSTDGGGNTRWIFTAAPSSGGGNFIAFFM